MALALLGKLKHVQTYTLKFIMQLWMTLQFMQQQAGS